jgi:hypothetical protein
MEPFALPSLTEDGPAGPASLPAPADDERDRRRSSSPLSSRAPGMGFGHELLLAMIMAVAMVATVLLYR